MPAPGLREDCPPSWWRQGHRVICERVAGEALEETLPPSFGSRCLESQTCDILKELAFLSLPAPGGHAHAPTCLS